MNDEDFKDWIRMMTIIFALSLLTWLIEKL